MKKQKTKKSENDCNRTERDGARDRRRARAAVLFLEPENGNDNDVRAVCYSNRGEIHYTPFRVSGLDLVSRAGPTLDVSAVNERRTRRRVGMRGTPPTTMRTRRVRTHARARARMR